ncbi:hypothetical protein FA13DRAFT_780575 [Coprinellus micaceus]|uniref:Uncharacterized protein n=1 Tax=Coprinellus micaceus TaxID=71717 RepID=A0A4Y7S7V2_COPMI|nr:hypothetical protein FA13DRAFT_780575 [Coprinellus micaceus]
MAYALQLSSTMLFHTALPFACLPSNRPFSSAHHFSRFVVVISGCDQTLHSRALSLIAFRCPSLSFITSVPPPSLLFFISLFALFPLDNFSDHDQPLTYRTRVGAGMWPQSWSSMNILRRSTRCSSTRLWTFARSQLSGLQPITSCDMHSSRRQVFVILLLVTSTNVIARMFYQRLTPVVSFA